MNLKRFILLSLIATFFCLNAFSQTKSLVGSWKLVSQKVTSAGGAVFFGDSVALHARKIYTPNTFVVVSEKKVPQLNNKKIVSSVAGGRYSLVGDLYQEFTKFATYDGFETMKVKFKLTFEDGKMHTIGTLEDAYGNIDIYDEWYVKED